MWKQHHRPELVLYVLDKTNQAMYPKGVSRAQFFHYRPEKDHYISLGDFVMHPSYTKLSVEYTGDVYAYKISLRLYDEAEIADLDERAEAHYQSSIDFKQKFITERGSEFWPEDLDKYKEMLDRYMQNQEKHRDHIAQYRQMNFIELHNCQRTRKDPTNPWEIDAHEPLSDGEKQVIMPSVVALVAALPELSEPFKPAEYYQRLMEEKYGQKVVV